MRQGGVCDTYSRGSDQVAEIEAYIVEMSEVTTVHQIGCTLNVFLSCHDLLYVLQGTLDQNY